MWWDAAQTTAIASPSTPPFVPFELAITDLDQGTRRLRRQRCDKELEVAMAQMIKCPVVNHAISTGARWIPPQASTPYLMSRTHLNLVS